MSDRSLGDADPRATAAPVGDVDATRSYAPDPANTVGIVAGRSSFETDTAEDLPHVPGYRVLGEIAHGGMGRVLAAHDLSLDREVAIKVLLPGLSSASADRFVRESKITAKLPHPGIPPVHALGNLPDGSPFLAMKLIAGRTLAREMESAGRGRLVQVFEQVCQAVGFAHSRGIVHRDLKPANIMVGSFGEVQVMDWGLAKELPTADRGPPHEADKPDCDTLGEAGAWHSGATVAGSVLGTPAYMAPEQARGEIDLLGPPADVFALGGILCEVLTGKPPFGGRSTLEVIQRAAAADLAEAFARLDGCGADGELVALCKRCLSPNAADRPADGRVVAAAAAGYRAGVEERLRTAEMDKAAVEVKAAEQRKRRRVQLALIAAVVLLVLGGLAFAWWQDRQAGERRAQQARNGVQIEALLDRCEAAIADDDAGRAQLTVGEAENRADNFGADHLKDRLSRCRGAADVLVDLDRIDALRWGVEAGKFQGNAQAVREWPGMFLKIGVIVGQTPPARAAEAVNGSLVRDRLLAALDLWLVVAAQADRAALARILAEADPDPYREALRAVVQRSEWKAVATLAAKDEALRQPARFAEALASIVNVPWGRRLAVLSAAARARPRDFGVLMAAGSIYQVNDLGTAAERIAWYRGAVIVRPASVYAHNLLGIALSDKGELDEAIAEYRQALKLDPKFAYAYNNLGFALRNKGDPDGAITEIRQAIKLNPREATFYNTLGLAQYDKGTKDEAIVAWREAIKLDPKFAPAHNNLGNVRYVQGDLDGAIAKYQDAIKADRKYALAHFNLGNTLRDKGDLDGAIASYKETIQLSPRNTEPANAIRRAERWRDLLPRLANIADGGTIPASAEACELATLAAQPFQRRYALAVRLFTAAFAADPTLADNLAAEHRYYAACAAVLAGCAQGVDAPTNLATRSALRAKARAWLRADLVLYARHCEAFGSATRNPVAVRMTHWLNDRDLNRTRPDARREGWTRQEMSAWDALWSEVRTILAKAKAPSSKSAPDERSAPTHD